LALAVQGLDHTSTQLLPPLKAVKALHHVNSGLLSARISVLLSHCLKDLTST
jgi:hypothetical protein